MDIDIFYRKLEIAAREIFGDFNVNSEGMVSDSYGRGGSPDDIVYVLSRMGEKKDDGEWEARKLQWVIKAVKMYTEEYCRDRGIEMPDMYMRNDGYNLYIVKRGCPVYTEDVRGIEMLFVMTTFSKSRIEESLEDVVPKFLSKPVEFGYDKERLKASSLTYRENGQVVFVTKILNNK